MGNPVRFQKEKKAQKQKRDEERKQTKADKTKKKAQKRKNDSESDDDPKKKKPKFKKPMKVCPKTLTRSSSPADIEFNGKLFWNRVPIHVVRRIISTVYTILETDNDANVDFGKRKI